MAFRSPWSHIGEALMGIAGLGQQYVAEQEQQSTVQGQQIKTEVGQQVGEMEAALADPNYKWQEPQRAAAEAFVTQGRTLLSMDDSAVPGSYKEWQSRGIRLPSTVIKQGAAGKPMQAQTTLKPYEGGTAGFIGDINQGVTQATQKQEEYTRDLELGRQIALQNDAQGFQQFMAQLGQKYNVSNAELESDLGMKAFNAQLNAQDSAGLRDQYITDIQQFAGSDDPNDQALVQQIIADAQASGLRPYHLEAVKSATKGIKSTRAGMDYQAANEALFQGTLTTDQMELQNELSRQNIKVGNQTFQLGELQLENERWLTSRRATEATLSDTAAVQNLLGTAYAQGDTGFIQERINILESGDESNPQYQALVSAGVTAEELEGKLTTVRENEGFRLRERNLQDALIEEEYSSIFFRGETNKSTLLDTLAKRYTPKELEQKMADENDPLGRMVDAGMLADTDMRAVSRQALLYRDLENEELLAPKVERAWKKLEVYAAVPGDRAVAENGLRSTLSGLVEAGVMSQNEAEGVVTTYKQGWDYGAQVQDADLATSIANRTYAEAQATALKAEVETLNAESDPLTSGLSEEQQRYYQTLRGTYTESISALMDEAELQGCGFSPDGLGVDPSGGEACANYAAQVRQERNKLVDLGNTLTLGSVDASTRVRDLADRMAAGNATPQEEQEFLTFERAMGEDTVASILGVPVPGTQPTEGKQEDQGAAPAQPDQGGVLGGVARSLWNFGPGGATTQLQEQLSEPTSEGQAAQTERRGVTPPWSKGQRPSDNPEQGPPPVLQSNPEFGRLIEGIKGNKMGTDAQRDTAGLIAQSLGMTTTQVLEYAQSVAWCTASKRRATQPPGVDGERHPRQVQLRRASARGGRTHDCTADDRGEPPEQVRVRHILTTSATHRVGYCRGARHGRSSRGHLGLRPPRPAPRYRLRYRGRERGP